jgi:hypothetical protein
MKANKHGLPEIFRPLLWSYRFEDIDPVAHEQEVMINTINYGDLEHWRWLINRYGVLEVKRVLTTIPVTEIRRHVRRLVSILFGISEHEFNHTPRGAH